MLVINVLSPDEEDDVTEPVRIVVEEKQDEKKPDPTRRLRLQVINIKGEIVDI